MPEEIGTISSVEKLERISGRIWYVEVVGPTANFIAKIRLTAHECPSPEDEQRQAEAEADAEMEAREVARQEEADAREAEQEARD